LIVEAGADVQGDRELLVEVLEMFLEEYPRLFGMLEGAVAAGDRELVQTTAHALKGMMASLSFRGASAMSARIEDLAREGAMTGMEGELVRLDGQAAKERACLEGVCRADADGTKDVR
jgi:two-component system sensor histidine kinase/response regulator